MQDRDKYYIPKLLDEPFRIWLLTLDEFIVLVVPIVIGFVFAQIFISFISGIGLLVAVKKFKGEQGHFYIMGLAYWYLPALIKFKATPPSHNRKYLG